MNEPAVTVRSVKKSEPKQHDLQTRFLSALLGKPVILFTNNGARLNGTLREYDLYTLQIDSMLIFKSAIVSLQADRRSSDPVTDSWKRRGCDDPPF